MGPYHWFTMSLGSMKCSVDTPGLTILTSPPQWDGWDVTCVRVPSASDQADRNQALVSSQAQTFEEARLSTTGKGCRFLSALIRRPRMQTDLHEITHVTQRSDVLFLSVKFFRCDDNTHLDRPAQTPNTGHQGEMAPFKTDLRGSSPTWDAPLLSCGASCPSVPPAAHARPRRPSGLTGPASGPLLTHLQRSLNPSNQSACCVHLKKGGGGVEELRYVEWKNTPEVDGNCLIKRVTATVEMLKWRFAASTHKLTLLFHIST